MSETNETADKPAKDRKPLRLKRTVESGHVQQKFGQGRSKSVVVEKKRKRTVTTPTDRDEQAPRRAAARSATRPVGRAGSAGSQQDGGAQVSGQAAGGLSKDEIHQVSIGLTIFL